MSDLASIIWAVAGLIAAVSLFKIVFFPPKNLAAAFGVLMNLFGPIRRLKIGSLEAEIDTVQRLEAEKARLIKRLPNDSRREEAEPFTADDSEAEREQSSSNKNAISYFKEGKYKEGVEAWQHTMIAMRPPEDHPGMMAFGYFLALDIGLYDALEDLKLHSEKHPSDPLARLWLARAYRKVTLHSEALDELRKALDLAGSDSLRITIGREIAQVLLAEGSASEAFDMLEVRIQEAFDPEAKSEGLRALAGLALDSGRVPTAFAMWEAALALTPEDRDLRFSVAYSYAQNEAPAIALYHYKRVLDGDPNFSVAWNNAGVAAERLSSRRLRRMAGIFREGTKELRRC